MLLNLSLQNFVLVDELQLDFNDGFTVLTGETGAGKSITLSAIGLLLGDKADSSQVRIGEKEAKLSALFSIENLPVVQNLLYEQGFAEENSEELTIRRIISIEGKSRNFINGQTATLSQLKQIGSLLIDIHGQHMHYSLMSESNQRDILDAFSGSLKQSQEVKKLYKTWQDAIDKLNLAQNNSEQIVAERERLEWQHHELSQINPQKDEWEQLSQNYDILAHATDILTAAQNCKVMIENDNGIQTLIYRCIRELEDLSNIEPKFNESINLLHSIDADLSEVFANLKSVASKTDVDTDELAHVDARMKELTYVARKFHIEENKLPEKLTEIEQRLDELDTAIDCEALQKQVEETYKNYFQAAKNLSNLRKKGAAKFSQEVENIMHELSMENATFHVALEESEPSPYGLEKVQYQIAMNKGSELRTLTKTASGGELARISLAIAVCSSSYAQVPTLIFDEVDSGIGGKVAEIVGKKLNQLAQSNQIMVITHLAQVASYANQHWKVEKQEQNNQTISNILILNKSERIEEIARMIGGENITPTVITHAKEMLDNAQK